ncbi:hypothetical protein ATCC90586_006810 [Pythium insidiosum]|nr:hypothetical protein ATCC90586_006810 [Pythium insidiosum]
MTRKTSITASFELIGRVPGTKHAPPPAARFHLSVLADSTLVGVVSVDSDAVSVTLRDGYAGTDYFRGKTIQEACAMRFQLCISTPHETEVVDCVGRTIGARGALLGEWTSKHDSGLLSLEHAAADDLVESKESKPAPRDWSCVLAGSAKAECGISYHAQLRLHLSAHGIVTGESLEGEGIQCPFIGQWSGIHVQYTLHYNASWFVYTGRLEGGRFVGRWQHAVPSTRNATNQGTFEFLEQDTYAASTIGASETITSRRSKWSSFIEACAYVALLWAFMYATKS